MYVQLVKEICVQAHGKKKKKKDKISNADFRR